jgi:hemerythrin
MYSLSRADRQEGKLALLTWSKKYSVGVQTLDDQHKGMLCVLNELHAAMMRGQAQKAVGPLCIKLLGYTRDHFSTEERMMSETRFPGLAEHQAKHQELARKVGEYAARYQQGGYTLYIQLLNFVREWLTGHIQKKEDQELGAWLNAHGVH